MSFDAARQILTQRFEDSWTQDGNPYSPIEWENRAFQQPKGTLWVRFVIRPGTRDAAAVGRRFTRTIGLVYVQIFTPENTGTRTSHAAAQKVADIFDFQSFLLDDGEIQCGAVSEDVLGKTGDGWQQTNAVFSYRMDQVRSGLELLAMYGETVITGEEDISS